MIKLIRKFVCESCGGVKELGENEQIATCPFCGKDLITGKDTWPRFWKDGDTTYKVRAYDYPHDERCEGTMCWCADRAAEENPGKWRKFVNEHENRTKNR